MIDIEKVAALHDARLDRWIAGEQQDKRGVLGQLVLLRFMIRKNLQAGNTAWETLRYYERQKNILKKLGAAVPFLEVEIRRRKEFVKIFHGTLRKFGESLFTLLDAWEEAGATREDLCNLCNAHRLEAWAKQKIAEEPEQTLSSLLFVYNLDYAPDGTGWIDDKADAPFTHAAKEYMLDIMLHTAKGREASHNALMEVFPEMMENTMTMRVDEFGQKCLYDHEGNFIGPVTPE